MAYGITVMDLYSDFVLLEVHGEPPYLNNDIYLNLLKSGDDTSTVYPIDFEVGTEVYALVEIDGLEPSTKYEAWCTYNEGNAFYECEFKTESGKPTSFKWDIAKISGQPIRLSASEWNKFTKKVNEWLKAKGKSTVSFTTVLSGGLVGRNVGTSAEGLSADSPKVISKKILNEAVDALNSMLTDSNKIAYPTGISASFLNDIVDKMNNL